jgi:hypothetical protein
MSDINSFALQQATAAAAKLWALGSAPFPYKTSTAAVIHSHIDMLVTETAIDFAIHVRRILDNSAIRTKFTLDEQFRAWVEHRLPRVMDLRDALNRIVHATEFEVGFERLPDNSANIRGGAIGVVYLRTRTDQRDEALIDVFALASCFFHQVLPKLHVLGRPSTPEAVQ